MLCWKEAQQRAGYNARDTMTTRGAQRDNVFELTTQVRFSEVDHRKVMTIPAIINMFQDCVTFQGDAVGLTHDVLKAEMRAWVLTHWHIVIDRAPRLHEQVALGTFASRFRGMLANRNFYLRDESGELLVRANSSWGFIDLATGTLTRAEARFTEPYGTHEALAMPPESRSVRVPPTLAACDPIRVIRHHIDINEHVNNSQYVLMALDLIPHEEHPRSIRVDYRRPAVLGDTIYPKMACEVQRYVVALCDAEDAPYATVELA